MKRVEDASNLGHIMQRCSRTGMGEVILIVDSDTIFKGYRTVTLS